MNSLELKEFRQKHGLTQDDLAKLVGVKAGTVAKWEQGARNIGQSAIKILENYASSPHKVSVADPIINKNGNKFVELPDGTYDVIVKQLPFRAYATYAETMETGQVFEDFSTTTFNVDRVGRGNYMAFIVKGDSMNGGKIDDTPDGAKVLGRELGRHHWKDGFSPTEYGWIILSRQNIFHKDIIDYNPDTGEITCHSRNPSPEYSDFNLNLNDVYQIFKVIKRIF